MASKVAPKAPYLNILDGSLIENDTLFNTLTRLLDHCSEYRINCDYCPNKHQCERIFSIISESVHHKNMSFDQLIKATERLLPLMKKKQLNLPIVKAIQFLYRELAYGPVPVAELIIKAREEGFGVATLYRAKGKLNIISMRNSNGKGVKSHWRLRPFSQKMAIR